jgi:hypothetical protein
MSRAAKTHVAAIQGKGAKEFDALLQIKIVNQLGGLSHGESISAVQDCCIVLSKMVGSA